jgi:hypothetical protein
LVRPASPRTGPEADGRRLTRDSSFTFSTPANPPAASKDDDWSQLDDIFRRQPTAGQASIGTPAHSLIDEPQGPLPEPAQRLVRPTPAAASKPASKPAHEAPAAGRKPARSGPFGIPSAFKRVTNWLGLGRSPSSTPARAASPRPPHAEPRPSTAPPAIPKLSVEQARREGKAVPSRPAPPPPSTTGSVGHAGRSSTPPVGKHETGALASLGQHYDGLWRDLRRSINGANRALESLPTTPRKGLAAKRAELEHCAAELTRLIDETGMARVDLKTVDSLKDMEGPKAPNESESLRARAITVGWGIHETIRQRKHARGKLDTLKRAIASIPGSALA